MYSRSLNGINQVNPFVYEESWMGQTSRSRLFHSNSDTHARYIVLAQWDILQQFHSIPQSETLYWLRARQSVIPLTWTAGQGNNKYYILQVWRCQGIQFPLSSLGADALSEAVRRTLSCYQSDYLSHRGIAWILPMYQCWTSTSDKSQRYFRELLKP